ncbi:hypothetical protein DK847_13760 [Aestuariivirga litoralis]|uniref:PilZ domain-containing protein n=1 Tax=Aestuariivirga litoralis TaxID=2650924 RepID=A0A2W2B871_9HYPH|nr:hypothetical protein [Aestuariivirga litoralis]PZF76258.1 hypothetical protein DK847_13760 [Aestuariivirga litoralis]
MDTVQSPLRNIVMRFAEIVDQVGKRLHVGCVMAAGQDWVEVSIPEHLQLGSHLQVRFLPSTVSHDVSAGWRGNDRVGFTYDRGGPPEDQFAGIPGLLDPRPASLKTRR